jgi:hypothetical protein
VLLRTVVLAAGRAEGALSHSSRWRVCKVAGRATLRAGATVPRVPLAEAARDCTRPERDPVLGEVSAFQYVGLGHRWATNLRRLLR